MKRDVDRFVVAPRCSCGVIGICAYDDEERVECRCPSSGVSVAVMCPDCHGLRDDDKVGS